MNRLKNYTVLILLLAETAIGSNTLQQMLHHQQEDIVRYIVQIKRNI